MTLSTPKKDELLVLWHKQCLETRSDAKNQTKVACQIGAVEASTIQFDEKVPELYHPAASQPASKIALWCPPLGFTSPHFLDGSSSSRRINTSNTSRSSEERPLLTARSSMPLTSRSDTLLSTKEACWAESLRSTDARGGTHTSFLRAVTPWSRLRHGPQDASSPRARREQLIARIALSGHAATSLTSLDPPPPGARDAFPREGRGGAGASSLSLRRLLRPVGPAPAPPMVFERPRPALLDESLTRVDLSRDWYFERQRRRACGTLSWTTPHCPDTHPPVA
jgi:hypothetical protein